MPWKVLKIVWQNWKKKAKENKEKVVIHCQFGQERTGIMLVIYLMEFKGFNVIRFRIICLIEMSKRFLILIHYSIIQFQI